MVASMDGAAVRVVEADENGDSLFDRSDFYDRTGVSSRTFERVERRGAGITRREVFEGGALVSAQEDRDADGRTDRWERMPAVD